MTHTTLIRNASVVTPTEVQRSSVLLEGSRIAAIDAAIHTEADDTIDAHGLHLIPGVIDDQVHFREPGLTHKEELATASRACAKGGVTTFLEMPNTSPTTTSVERLHEKLQLASTRSLVNYGFYIGATPDNLDDLQRAERTPGIKIFIGSSTGNLLVDQQEILERIFAETTLPITAHCEDEATIRSNQQKYADVTDVAVFGIGHDRWGETPVAAIVLQPGSKADGDSVRDWANERVSARFQKVSEVLVLDSFPRSVAGKTLRRIIKQDYVEESQ